MICTVCNNDKNEIEFPVLTRDENKNPLTYRKLCKSCYANKRSNNIAYKEKQNAKDRHKTMLKKLASEETQGLRTCKICQIQKLLNSDNYAIVRGEKENKEYINFRKDCRDCCNKQRREDNEYKLKANEKRRTDEYREKRKEYRQRDNVKASRRRYENKKCETDILFKLKKRIRDRTSKFLKASGWIKESSFTQYIGCTPEQLRKHLEKQFKDGMTWDNYGHGEGKHTIDHIIPLSSAKTTEEMYKLCHFSNLQPMWYIDNVKKGNKKE